MEKKRKERLINYVFFLSAIVCIMGAYFKNVWVIGGAIVILLIGVLIGMYVKEKEEEKSL